MNAPHVFVNWLMWIIVYLKSRICSWASMFWNQEFCAVLYLSISALLKSICMISAVRSLLPHKFLTSLDNIRPSLVGATARIILLQSYFFRFLNFYSRERGDQLQVTSSCGFLLPNSYPWCLPFSQTTRGDLCLVFLFV